MANSLKCEDCCYYWADMYEDNEGERPYCHWESRCPGDVAPCEEDDSVYDEDGWEQLVDEY